MSWARVEQKICCLLFDPSCVAHWGKTAAGMIHGLCTVLVSYMKEQYMSHAVHLMEQWPISLLVADGD